MPTAFEEDIASGERDGRSQKSGSGSGSGSEDANSEEPPFYGRPIYPNRRPRTIQKVEEDSPQSHVHNHVNPVCRPLLATFRPFHVFRHNSPRFQVVRTASQAVAGSASSSAQRSWHFFQGTGRNSGRYTCRRRQKVKECDGYYERTQSAFTIQQAGETETIARGYHEESNMYCSKGV